MASNSVVVNGNIKYEVPDHKMKAVDEVLSLACVGAQGVGNNCPLSEVGRADERRKCRKDASLL